MLIDQRSSVSDDDVLTTVGETPSDGVKDPKHSEDGSRNGKRSLETTAEVLGTLPSGAEEDPQNVEHGNSTESPET
jgi:hypothetical protein